LAEDEWKGQEGFRTEWTAPSSSCKPARRAAASSLCRLWTRRRGVRKLGPELIASRAFPVHAFDVATLDVQPGVDNVLHGLSVRHLSFLGLKSESIRTSATPICKDELSGSHRPPWIMRVDHARGSCAWITAPWDSKANQIILGFDASPGEGGTSAVVSAAQPRAGRSPQRKQPSCFGNPPLVRFHVDVSSHPVFYLHPGMERRRFVESTEYMEALEQIMESGMELKDAICLGGPVLPKQNVTLGMQLSIDWLGRLSWIGCLHRNKSASVRKRIAPNSNS
jgi:hypothetical protein